MDNHLSNPVQYVYSSMPNKWYSSSEKILEDTFTLSEISSFDSTNIKSLKIIDSKQYSQIDEDSYSSLYTLMIKTTADKEIFIPFVVTLSMDGSNSFTFTNPIGTDNCTLFHQNELNSQFDGTT